MQPALKHVLHCLADNALRRHAVVLHEGAAGTMLVAGEERWSGYLPDRFFGDAPRERRHLGTFRSSQLPAVLDRWQDAADITVARVDGLSQRFFPASAWLRVPEWVRMVAPVTAAGQAPGRRSVRDDRRVVRRSGLTWRLSHDPRELDVHLERDYYPYTQLRHGADAFVQPAWRVRQAFRRGGLLCVERAGEAIAGLVFDHRPPVFSMLTIACARADESLLRAGAIAGVYLFSFECARSLGLRFIDMRGCRPCPHDRLFFFKSKYGAVVGEKDDVCYDWLVRWKRASPLVRGFLSGSPLIFRDSDGLSVLHGRAEAEPLPAGLRRRFVVRPEADFGAWDPESPLGRPGDASGEHDARPH
jgi:hypothetical protein